MRKFQKNAAVVKNVDKSNLRKAPTVTKKQMDKLDTPEFGSRIHGYYRDAIKD